MESRVKKFKNFETGFVRTANLSEFENTDGSSNWSSKDLSVRKNNKAYYKFGNVRISEIRDAMNKLSKELMREEDEEQRSEIHNKIFNLDKELTYAMKNKKDAEKKWILTSNPPTHMSTDLYLIMTEKDADEVNDAYATYIESKNRYENFIEKYKK